MEVLFIPAIHAKKRNLVIKVSFLEAPTRFELVIEVLQTFALPLGHRAIHIKYMHLVAIYAIATKY